jgi:PAS domain S-box-containing protein
LAVGITAAVTLVCAAGAAYYSSQHFSTLMERERQVALGQADLMRAAIDHGMIQHDRGLIAELVSRLGSGERVRNVWLLDRAGRVQISSKPGDGPISFDLSSPTCQACHQLPPSERDSSRTLELAGGTTLRVVLPIHNRPACYSCHDARSPINGVLMYDRDIAPLRADASRDLRSIVAITGVLALGLIAGIAVLVRLVVLKRVDRLETAARQVVSGDLDRRVPTEGTDSIAWLGREFNTMADSVTNLVGEVRGQRERLETIINSIDDGIVVLDAKRNVVAANDAFLTRSGHERGSVLGCSCTDHTMALCSAIGNCPTIACLDSGEHQVRIIERVKGDGTVCWEEIHASPVPGPSGELVQVVEVWRDISERRNAEARLAESHRLASLGLLASGFSHELNTPLGTVLTCVESILRETHADGARSPAVGEHLTIARDQILRCRGITQHFLRLSRGQRSMTLIDLGDAIGTIVRLIAPTARARGVHLDASDVPASLTVRVDEAELQHAVMNLLLNAIQACQPGGFVRLCARPGPPVRIEVTDTGCGIAPEQQRQIFEPFFSLRPGGTGLGLFISLNFVRGWGGDIVVNSTPARGSTFSIVIPPADAPIARSAAAS